VDNQDLNDLKTAFLQHEAVCEERWKTIFNEVKEGKEESRERWLDLQSSISSLNKLVLSVGGAAIVFLMGVVVSGNIL
jgi:hypothetical protein